MTHVLDPTARGLAVDFPKGPRGFVDYRGKAVSVFEVYDLWPRPKFRYQEAGFEAFRMKGKQKLLTIHDWYYWYSNRPSGYAQQAPRSSPSKQTAHTPLPIWMSRVSQSQRNGASDRLLYQTSDKVTSDNTASTFFHGATHRSNNSREVTAVGEAAIRIQTQPSSQTVSYEICSDSYCRIDEVDVLIGAQSTRVRNGTLKQNEQ